MIQRVNMFAPLFARALAYAGGALKTKLGQSAVHGLVKGAGPSRAIARHVPYERDIKNRMVAIDKDIVLLLDHTNYVSGQVRFLLNASLGLINIEQSAIIKLFSAVSVALMPPTLIASLYGMNFKQMPEFDWVYGYPMALCLIMVSALLAIRFFKRIGWF